MHTRVVVLGAGFGGLELTTILSGEFGSAIDIVLIDKADAFVFGFSKLDVMFGRIAPAEARHPYSAILKPGVRFLQSTVQSMDPLGRRVETDRGTFDADILVVALGADMDPGRKVAVLNDGTEMPCDLFLGVPVHRVPTVVEASGLAVGGWVPVNPKTLETRFPGVYAVGDVTSVDTAKAGVFAEGAARVAAAGIIAKLRGGPKPGPYAGAGSCSVEFGHGLVGRVDVDFLSGPKPTGTFQAQSVALAAEKVLFGSSRLQRWFGHPAPARG